jgi:hypothetical protein
MLTVNALIVESVLLKSRSMNITPGATIEDASGLIKVIEEIRPRRSHLRCWGKLRGMAGSSCPSQPIIPTSRSVTGIFSRSRRSSSFLARVVNLVTTREILVVVDPWVGARSRISSSGGLGVIDSP